MLWVKVGVGLTAAILLVLKLTGGVGGFGSGDRIDATAVTLLVVIAAVPMLDRITKIGTEGIEVQPAAELDAVRQQLDEVASPGPSASGEAASPGVGTAEASGPDPRAAAQDPLALVVASRTMLADTLRAQVRHRGAGMVGPSIADNARRLADHGLITPQLRTALTELGIKLDTARRPSPQYAADIADLVHTAIGQVNQQVQEQSDRSG